MPRPQGIATALVGTDRDTPDLLYVSGFRAVDPVVWVGTRDRQAMVVPAMEYGRTRAVFRRGRVWTPEQLGLRGPNRRRVAMWVWAALRELRVRFVRVPPSFPLGIARALEQRGVRVRVARDALFSQRATKRQAELKAIQRAQRAAVEAMRAAVRVLSEASIGQNRTLRWQGNVLTSERVRYVIESVLLHHDCVCEETIVAGGRQGADPHERGHGPLRADEPIVLDVFPRHRPTGYFGDLTRTVVRGRCPDRVRAMFDAVRRARRVALGRVRAGVLAEDVHRAVERSFEESGFATEGPTPPRQGFLHGTGHGVGLAVHEAPSLSRGSRDRLRVGHVITIEPGLYDPELGGVRIEDTLVVGRSGWRPLAVCPVWTVVGTEPTEQ